jgi:hypothetical protein
LERAKSNLNKDDIVMEKNSRTLEILEELSQIETGSHDLACRIQDEVT